MGSELGERGQEWQPYWVGGQQQEVPEEEEEERRLRR